MAKRTPSETINRLQAVQQFQLMQLVKEEYATHAVTDVAFAEYASSKLGFPVTRGNVGGAREAWGIESTRVAIEHAKPNLMIERVKALESAVKALQESVAELRSLNGQPTFASNLLQGYKS